MGFNGLSYCLPHLCFELTWGQQQEFPRINGTGAARIWYRPNVYQGIMEFTNSILISFIVYFMGTFSTALYAAIGAAVDNQTDSQQSLTHHYAFSA
jgi:hypothetical protein